MKIISWNVNGIRAVEKKGDLQSFLERENPDIFFLQEIKAQVEQLSEFLNSHPDYHQFYFSAEKPGYSGVGAWVKKSVFPEKPKIQTGMPDWQDKEGRIIRLDFNDFTAIGVYFPNGGKSEAAWAEKLEFYGCFLHYVHTLRNKEKRRVIWCGDLNVAHNEIDLARPKENEGNIGFRIEERKWVDQVIADGWIDVFRDLHPGEQSYTWWQMRTRARDRNVGWRIDYFFVDSNDLKNVKQSSHISGQMGSDHCPVILEIR